MHAWYGSFATAIIAVDQPFPASIGSEEISPEAEIEFPSMLILTLLRSPSTDGQSARCKDRRTATTSSPQDSKTLMIESLLTDGTARP
jgi:hypothetical protein